MQRKGDLVARLGGDEFACLMEGASPEALDAVATRMLASLRAPIALEGAEVSVGSSIGIATWPDCARDAQGLFDHADRAMYQVKKNDKGSYGYFVA